MSAVRANATEANVDNASANEDVIKMTRGDFWNAIFAINKEYANAEALPILKGLSLWHTMLLDSVGMILLL